jgi:DNA polymerase
MSSQRFQDTIDLAKEYFRQQADLGTQQWYVRVPGRESTASPSSLAKLYEQVKDCRKCHLCETRTHLVFGSGNEEADLVFIGEAPGRDEDLQGQPFVGRAGQLLTRIIEAIQLRRESVYIGNILKCRPPDNRDPLPEEIHTCLPILDAQLQILRPKMICALGRISAQTLLQTQRPITQLRGSVHDLSGAKLIVTYHPAALLRNPGLKRPTWEDMQMLRKEMDRLQ